MRENIYTKDARQFSVDMLRIAEYNRTISAENLFKSAAPNADELCGQKLDFADVMKDLQMQKQSKNQRNNNFDKILESNTSSGELPSTRQASVDFSQATIFNNAMKRLVEHSYKQHKSIVDQARFS